jgi:hypothetical protein
MLLRVAFVTTDASEEISAFIIRVTRFSELETLCILSSFRRLLDTANVVRSSPILVIMMMEVLSSSEKLVLTRATCRNI